MMNNKPKGKQQQAVQPKSQPKKGSKNQRTQPQSQSTDANKTLTNPNNNKPKIAAAVPEANRNTSASEKTDPNVSNLTASLKRLNFNSNKKASKTNVSSQQNPSNNKRNHYPSSGTSRTKSRGEDHKNDPMGHKKNQFGKMRLTEFLNIDHNKSANSNTSAGNSNTAVNSSLSSSSSPSSSNNNIPCAKCSTSAGYTNYSMIDPMIFTGKQFQKRNPRYGSSKGSNNNNQRNEPRNVMMNSTFVPIEQPKVPILSSSNIAAVIADTDRFTIFEKTGKLRTSYPIMQIAENSNNDWGGYKPSMPKKTLHPKLRTPLHTISNTDLCDLNEESNLPEIENPPTVVLSKGFKKKFESSELKVNTPWFSRRRPVATSLPSNKITELSRIKIELVKLQYDTLKEEAIAEKYQMNIKHDLKRKSMELDIEIKSEVLKKIRKENCNAKVAQNISNDIEVYFNEITREKLS